MRLKLLILGLLLTGGALIAQEVDMNLVITEARYGRQAVNYIELTNMGDDPINLMPYRFGGFHPWTSEQWSSGDNETIMLGEFIKEYSDRLDVDTILDPGESIWITQVDDWQRMMGAKYPDQYGEKSCRDEQWTADLQIHRQEYSYRIPADSVTDSWELINMWGGRDIWFIAVYTDTDTIVVDQIGGVFDQENDRNRDGSYPVAGITDATATHSFVRKFGVKEGNINFAEGKGNSLEDSEWIPLPPLNDWAGNLQYRKLFWTLGNHGDYQLTENTLQSDILDINFADGVINVPWGIHNEDSVMMCIDYTPGLAWDYQLNTDTVGGANWEQAWQDSGYISARTGDTLWILACGNELTKKGFHINVLPPTEDANWIIPMDNPNFSDGTWPQGPRPRYEVSHGYAMDTIYEVPFATRTDTIQTYFEKAPNASWEFVFVDGVEERPDVMEGDILRVTAENGDVKDYYIQVEDYAPSHNAELASITWPDAPGWVKETGIYGWTGDTIPGFTALTRNYRVKVPNETVGIPGLIAKPQDLNTEIEVERAKTLFGSVADKTISFTVTAEDDTTVNVYNVEIEREPLPENVQPYEAEPFFSEYVWRDQWQNYYLEIMNPGTTPIDMSNYMIMMQWTSDWEAMIGWDSETDVWESGRMLKYIPGYRWVDSLTWVSGKERFVTNDFENVDPILQPGETFVIGHTTRWDQKNAYEQDWIPEQEGVLDVEFAYNIGRVSGGLDYPVTNPWGEKIGGNSAIGNWEGACMFMVKIVGDSIHDGLKATTDVEDFEIIEAWGTDGGGNWIVDGENANAGNQCVTFRRKATIAEPNPQVGASFGPTPEESEWERYDQRWGVARNMGWSEQIMHVTEDLNNHFMNTPTLHMSTVGSVLYQVTEGYSMEEGIVGIIDGATVDDVLANLIKKDEGQEWVIRRNGDTLANDAVVAMDDSLVVLSANGQNTSRYHLDVTADGLNSDAVLTSTTYDIAVDGETGTVSGVELGTTIVGALANITVPAGAQLQLIDGEGKYISQTLPNFDTIYIDVPVSDDVYLEVTAEDNVTMITYQMQLASTASDAFVVSAVYDVDQDAKIIALVPGGTTVPTFYSNLIPSAGATMQVKDKLSFDRNMGNLYLDDKLVVTSSDGEVTNTYFLTMLEREADYLAYVLSDVYLVDQDAFTIDASADINNASTVTEFLANLEAAPGASMTVMSGDMVAKTGDEDMDVGDILEVMAGNEVTVVHYDITIDPTSASDALANGISVYPNPSNGVVNVRGLEAGTRIQVYNAQGARVMDNLVYNSLETVSIKDKGMYIMVISNDKGVLGNYKLVIE